MAIIRTYAEVLDLEPTAAEKDLIEKCQAGEPCVLGGDVPTEPSDSLTIRADILRYLLLGGCEDCVVDGRGVWLVGGYISGTLNLNYAKVHGATQLRKCHFEKRFDSVQTRFTMVNLVGSALSGWFAQGAEVEGSVFLDGITTSDAINLKSATINGALDCSNARLTAKNGAALGAQMARVEGHVFLRNIICTATIDLNGTVIGGQLACDGADLSAKKGDALTAQRAKIEGSVFFREITTSATIDLHGTTIGGTLFCEGAQIKPTDDYAISAQNARISGGIVLHPRTPREREHVETPFNAIGELRFNGATIGGVYAQQVTLVATASGQQTLSLGGATVNGPVRLDGCNSTGEILLAGSRISGRLTCERINIRNDKGHAFNGQAMRVEHSFVWKKVEHTSGAVSLNGAHVAELNDDPENWPDTDDLFLDGFTYDRIKGTVSTSPARMGWLKNGSFFDGEFRPQPFSQYAKFLRAVGHDSDARRVLEDSEGLARADQRRRRMDPYETQGLNDLQWKWNIAQTVFDRTIVDPGFKWVIGYGHAPFRALRTLLLLIVLCTIPSYFAFHRGEFAPNSAVILQSDGWNAPEVQNAPNPAAAWSDATGQGRDWESFSAGAYALDVVIPIINFGQTDAWAPSTTRGWLGYLLWCASWFFTVLGWLVTALGAAAITGIIRRE